MTKTGANQRYFQENKMSFYFNLNLSLFYPFTLILKHQLKVIISLNKTSNEFNLGKILCNARVRP